MAGAVALAAVGIAAPTARANSDPGKEIAALQAIKRSLTPGERKLDSRLAVALRERKAAPTTEVDIRTTGDIAQRLLKLGANVRYVSPRTGEVRAAVPSAALRTVATWGEVERVDPAAQAMTMRFGGEQTTKEQRAAEAETIRRAAAVTSEGDRAHGADS